MNRSLLAVGVAGLVVAALLVMGNRRTVVHTNDPRPVARWERDAGEVPSVAPPIAARPAAPVSIDAAAMPQAHEEPAPYEPPGPVVMQRSDAGRFPYGDCVTSADCAEGSACFLDRTAHRFLCIASQCAGDNECLGGQACRAIGIRPVKGRAPVRICVEAGHRYEGDRCAPVSPNLDQTCQEGLVCIEGRCGTPCTPGREGTCRRGTACKESRDGPACAPDGCEKTGCATGEICAPTGPDRHTCVAAVTGDSCFEHACPDGESCVAIEGPHSVAYQCGKPCDENDPRSCPRGLGCGNVEGQSICVQPCSPRRDAGAFKCAEGFRCRTVNDALTHMGCVKKP